MKKKVIIMGFDTESKAYQAFSEVKALHSQGKISGEQMAVLQHVRDHKIEPKDFIDFTGMDKNLKGGLIGMVVGILGGPLGILLGWFTGSVIGTSKDVKEIKGAMSIFDETVNTIEEGSTGVILIAEEEKTGHIDDIVIKNLGGEVTRLDRDKVEQEVSDAVAAEKAAEDQAKKSWFKK